MPVMTPARLEANRRNAAKSTGPKTSEGKEASSRNALKHGLTGGGVALTAEDFARVDAIAAGLHADFRPSTTYGRSMLDRAALMIGRLERSARHERALITGQIRDAGEAFDADRRALADDIFDGLAADPAAALAELLRSPEGIDRLIGEWSTIDLDVAWTPEQRAKVERMTGQPGLDQASVRAMIATEIRRLEAARQALDLGPIARARAEALDLALFGTSPGAILARRYEMATDRALHKAMKAFRDAEAAGPDAGNPETPEPSASLGSFFPAKAAEPRPTFEAPTPLPVPLDPISPEPRVDRASRPDPRKLREARRRNRR